MDSALITGHVETQSDHSDLQIAIKKRPIEVFTNAQMKSTTLKCNPLIPTGIQFYILLK